MKKSNLILLVTSALLSITIVESKAQIAMKNLQRPSTDESSVYDRHYSRTSKVINFKAVKDFNQAYQNASEPEWSTLNDKSLMCRFLMNKILYRAFYTAHGKWLYTISGYDGHKLNKLIYHNIKSFYFDFEIVFVNQIDMTRGKTMYVVEIQDEKHIEKLLVQDDEMEVIQDIVKL